MAHTKLEVSPYGIRLWALAEDCHIVMHTDEGTLEAVALAGFVTDFRSPRGVAGDLVDMFIPNTGSIDQAACYLFHDLSYTCLADGSHPVSRCVADDLLHQSLKLAGMSDEKAMIVYDAVRLLGEDAYDAPTEWGNSSKFTFRWDK